MATFLPSMAALGLRMGAIVYGAASVACAVDAARRRRREWSGGSWWASSWSRDAARARCTRYLSRAFLRCERLPLSRGSWPLASWEVLATREAGPGRPSLPQDKSRKNPNTGRIQPAATHAPSPALSPQALPGPVTTRSSPPTTRASSAASRAALRGAASPQNPACRISVPLRLRAPQDEHGRLSTAKQGRRA